MLAMIVSVLFVLFCSFCGCFALLEEVQVHGPMDFHNTAMNKFVEIRRADPKANLSYNGEFLLEASKHAVKRLARKPDEEITVQRLVPALGKGGDGDASEGGQMLQLPGPEGQESYLTAAINAQNNHNSGIYSGENGAIGGSGDKSSSTTSGNNKVFTKDVWSDHTKTGEFALATQDFLASAAAFNEEIGLGAISKAGALPMGANGEWLALAEEKLKKDNSLDYQSLLWEMGSAYAESEAAQAGGGLNISYERELLQGMEQWYAKGGGVLRFAKPVVSSKSGFKLVATEEVLEMEPVVQMPLKLIMCRQTARNVVIANRGKYLGDELQKTFDKSELWGLTIFLLHEYYKEVAGNGSKWGPFIRTLRMRFLSTPVLQALKGTIAAHLSNKWHKDSDKFMWWSVGTDGPCSPTTGICKAKPTDKGGDSRFNIHQIRWAYWVVRQNAVRVKQLSTGLEFTALVPYYNMMDKRLGSGGGATFDFDGSVSVRVGTGSRAAGAYHNGDVLGMHPGNFSDGEFFLRYLKVPRQLNPHTEIKLKLPGAIPKGSKFHYCMKGTQKEMNRDDCKATFKSESMFWKSKVLTEWRQLMNLPPRLQELRMWATRLHLYGGQEEMAAISNANKVIAGLPIPVDQMPAEEQLMYLGHARDHKEATALILAGNSPGSGGLVDGFAGRGGGLGLDAGASGDRPPPQLYSAPDPTEDPEAQRSMENLAMLAVQAQNVLGSGNTQLNATQVVLNQTKDFFLHGALPKAGLDELDLFLLKKIGMLAHCGLEDDMKIVRGNITDELFCAMRVHLMNESEIHVFCPKDAVVWEENCQNVEFMNFTAISETNEMAVINALRNSVFGLLSSYPSSVEEDQEILEANDFSARQRAQGFFAMEDDELGGLLGMGTNDNSEEEEEPIDLDGTATRNDPNEASDAFPSSGQYGDIMLSAISVRLREKEVLLSALEFLDEHEKKVINGTQIQYQLALKAAERIEADKREAERLKFIEEVKEKARIPSELAFVEVDMGEMHDPPKVNLTLQEGQDLRQVVQVFCQKYGVKGNYVQTLETALRKRVVSPPPLQLMLGVVTPVGHRAILAIPEGANTTVETAVFCTQQDNSRDPTQTSWCQELQKRVKERVEVSAAAGQFDRKILVVVPIDAPDTRKLKLVVHEGEQHDLLQFVSDFFELYHLPAESALMMANEVVKRLPNVVLQIPVGLSSQRQVSLRLSMNDNITATTEAFTNYFEIQDSQMKIAIMKRARHGMAPGTFLE